MKSVGRVSQTHCDITAHTVLMYVLFCLTYMYHTLYVLYILHTVHTVHVPMFVRYSTCSHVCPVHVPMFVRASSLTFTYIHLVTFTSVTKHRSYSLSCQCHLIILACEATISILGGAHFDFQFYNICSVVLFNLTFHKTMSNSQGNKRKIVRLPEFPCSSTPEPV